MNIFPAMKGTMGSWNYYVIKMTMRELADNVKFANDIHDDRTLDLAIQRTLEKGRVKRDIVSYLIRQNDRFFSSLVVAALNGNPTWFPVTMEGDDKFALLDEPRLNDSFGVLRFNGNQDYFALDGQHRLAAIRALVDPQSDVTEGAPPNFRNEEVSVIVVVPDNDETHDEFLKRYRRLFGNLNRHAKAMDQVTNIIMDEDDAFAIVTRRLFSEHEFFKYSGRHKESPKIKTSKGKNLRPGDSFFTSLEALYVLNRTLLSSRKRRNGGWNEESEKLATFQRFRPSEQQLDELFNELMIYWDALFEELPVLREPPGNMRDHTAPEGDGTTRDCALFWPIVQELVWDVVRDLLDFRQQNPEAPTRESASAALAGLNFLVWDMHEPPWRHLVLVPGVTPNDRWRIRNEDRKHAMDVAKRILKWQLGTDELDANDINALREEWQSWLLPALDNSVIEELWSKIEGTLQR